MQADGEKYHPASGTPAYFVHPCNTADAMRHVADIADLTPEKYLLVWLGLIGNGVGLTLPRELFASDPDPEHEETSQ